MKIQSTLLVTMLALSTALASLIPTTAQAAPIYTVTALDNPPGAAGSSAYAINASGQIVGYSYSQQGWGTTPILWNGTAATALGTFGGTYSSARGINASGQIVGSSNLPGSGSHAALWDGATMTDLGTLGGTYSQAFGINASGQVAGSSNIIGDTATHATLWSDGNVTDLVNPFGGTYSQAYGINASGQVVGFASAGKSAFAHAILWSGGHATDLGTLGGTSSAAFAINISGQVAGYSDIAGEGDPAFHATLWSGGHPIDLGTLGGTNSYAFGINAAGDVIGMAQTTGDATWNAFLYTGGTMYDLNSLLAHGHAVTDLSVWDAYSGINDLGQIAASGTIEGDTRAFLLTPVTPVPEPATYGVLMALGLIGIGSVNTLRRKRRAQA